MIQFKKLLTTGLLALGLLTTPAVQASEKLPSGNTYDNIGSKIEAFVDKHKGTTAGMETAVFTTDETIYQGHFGYMDKAKGIKADETSVFEWGSTAKTVTWISVMQQVEAGRIDLKEDIRTYLPKGFLRNLKFDKPVTMLDLMNHKGGFQETNAYLVTNDKKSLLSLKEYLTTVQPPQIYEAGSVTAYSNWGTILAAHIVEITSGQDFADYVHENIFSPLGLSQTSIRPDLSDNAFVKQQRSRNKVYDSKGKPFVEERRYLHGYPSGSIVGTLKDLKTFAQALLKQEEGVIFKKQSTWDEFFSASDVYRNTDIARSRHGFLTTEYKVSVTEHGGNTLGYSNGLMLDLTRKVGFVVMTNQDAEYIYNHKMPELIFGKFEESPYFKLVQDEELADYYLPSRQFKEGPLSLINLFLIKDSRSKKFRQELSSQFYQKGQLPDGTPIISQIGTEYIPISVGQIIVQRVTIIVGGIALIYALSHLLWHSLTWLYRKVTKKRVNRAPKIWHHLVFATIILIGLIYLYMIAMMFTGKIQIYDNIGYFSITFVILGSILLGLLIWRIIVRPKGQLDWKAKLHYGLAVFAALATLWFIYFFDFYQWWVM